MSLAGGWEITRRYFVNQGFDGLLTSFGVIIGAFLININNAQLVIFPGLGGVIAVAISGFWIAFLTEEAELEYDKKEKEKMILSNLDDTIIIKAGKISKYVNSITDGLSPFFFGIIPIFPFFFVNVQMISIKNAYTVSFLLVLFILFMLGAILGIISNKSKFKFGIKTVLAGVLVALLMVVLSS